MAKKKTPKFETLVVNAIRRLQDAQGLSPREITNYITKEYDVPGTEIKKQIKLALKRGVSYGILQKSKGGYYTCIQDFLKRQPLDRHDINELKCRSRRRRRRSRRSHGCMRRRRSSRRRRGRKDLVEVIEEEEEEADHPEEEVCVKDIVVEVEEVVEEEEKEVEGEVEACVQEEVIEGGVEVEVKGEEGREVLVEDAKQQMIWKWIKL
ncbi:hypothetical protein M0802_009504 [Mischocyttarus mexicanus]|nr:hypothetical protein M0802_009504 [Mischocyttarus mexicanus]